MTKFATQVKEAPTQEATGATLLKPLLEKLADASKTSYVPFGEKRNITLSVSIVKKLLCKPTKSGRICSTEDALKFIAQCQARALNPFLGDAYLVGYDNFKTQQAEFSIITSVNVFYKRAEGSQDFAGIESGIICANQAGETQDFIGDFYPKEWEPVGGWAKVHKKGREIPTVSRLRLEAYKKESPFWTNDAAGMICKCAEVDALRRAFPSNAPGVSLEASLASADLGAALPMQEEKAITPAPPAESQALPQDDSNPELNPVPETTAGDPGMGEKQALLVKFFEEGKVSFDDFTSYLKTSGIYPQAENLPSFTEVPDKVCDAIMDKGWKAAKDIVRIFGAGRKA